MGRSAAVGGLTWRVVPRPDQPSPPCRVVLPVKRTRCPLSVDLLVPTGLVTLLLLAPGLATGCGPEPAPAASSASSDELTVPESDPTTVDEATFEATRNKAFQLDEMHADVPAAREALLAAHAMRPEAFGINKRLGAIHAELRLNLPAVKHYRMALDAHPDDNSVRQSLVALLAMVEQDEEMLAELPLLRADPDHAGEAIFLEARLRDIRGDRETAQALLAEADTLPSAEAYRALSLHGRFVFQTGDYLKAQELFERAQQGRPDYKEAVKGLGDCALRLGQTEVAEHWGEILSLLLALTDDEYVRRNEEVRSEKLVELLALMPEYTNGYKLLADIYRRNDKVAEACAVIEQFITLHGELLQDDDIAGLRQRYCQARKRAGQ